MALHQLVLFLLFLHCGLSDCQKINAVTVQEGQSAIIPCLYEKEHKDDTKLWCRKDDLKCVPDVNSKQGQSATGVSITDDITHGFFTVNMMNIRQEDAGDYCCTVKSKTKQPITKDCTQIKMSKDGPKLSVLNPMISGYESGTASVLFQHSFPGNKRQFCQLAGECVGWDSDSGSLNGMSVMLSDVKNGELKLTLSGLQGKNTGWYVCSVGGFQTPVHLNVTGIRPTPATKSSETTTNTQIAPNTDQRGMVEVLVPVGVSVLVLIMLCAAAVGLVRWRRGKRKAPQQSAADADSACENMYPHDTCKKRSPKHEVSFDQSADLQTTLVKDTRKKRSPKHAASSDQPADPDTIHTKDTRRKRSPEHDSSQQSADLQTTHVKDARRKRSPRHAVSSDQSGDPDAIHVKDTRKKRSPKQAVSFDQSADPDAIHVKDTRKKRSPRHAVSSDQSSHQSADPDAIHVKDRRRKRSPKHAVSSEQSTLYATHTKDTRKKRSPKPALSSHQSADLETIHLNDTPRQGSPEPAVPYDQPADLDTIYGNV